MYQILSVAPAQTFSFPYVTTFPVSHKLCPFGSGLKKFALDFVVVIFFKNEKNAFGGLISLL